MPNHLRKRVGKIASAADVAELFGGVTLKDRPTVLQALEDAGLNWETLVSPLCLSDKVRTKIPGFFGTYRRVGPSQNIPLGVVKSRYKPAHNRDSFLWLDQVLNGKTEAFIIAGGMIDEGKRVWVAVDLGYFVPVEGDEIRQTMVIMNSNDGSSHWTAHMIPNRLLGCVSLNFHDTDGFYKIRHTSGLPKKMEEVALIMKLGKKQMDEFEKTVKKMVKKTISTEQTDKLIYQSLGVNDGEFRAWYDNKVEMKQPQWVNQYEAIREMMVKGPGAETAPGTVWHLFTALSGYFDYIRTVRGSDSKKDNVYESRMIGYSAKQKYQAYCVCASFVG